MPLGKDGLIDISYRETRAEYIRDGIRAGGYPHKLADLADFMRGDQHALELDMMEPCDRHAAEWFVAFLAEQQHNLRVLARFGKWRS